MLRSSESHDWVSDFVPGLFSVVIPAHNEAENLQAHIPVLVRTLDTAGIAHEILVVNDNSSDSTREALVQLSAQYPSLRFIDTLPPNGFGFAVRAGLASFRGEAVAIVMADNS